MQKREHTSRREMTPTEVFVETRADYDASQATRFLRRRTGVSSGGSGADYHYRHEHKYLYMLEQARDMDRNDCIVGQTIDRAVTNTVQGGITLDPQTGDKGVNTEMRNRWAARSKDADQCDLAGEHTVPTQQRLIMRHTLVDGDILGLPTREGPTELVEAHRLRTPRNTKRNVVNGVLLDAHRRRLEYWLTKDDIDPLQSLARVKDIKPYKTRDADGHRQVFHVYHPKRATQTRGVTALAPIFHVAGMFEDVNFAKLVQAQAVSCFAIFRQRALAGEYGGAGNPVTGSQTTQTRTDGSTRFLEGISPGMIEEGEPGVELKGFSPNVPNAEFFDHVRLILTLVGINLGLPLVMVLMDAKETNFSGWRGAVNQARMGFCENQRMLIERFLQPQYETCVRQWLADDPGLRATAEKSNVDIFAHRWKPPRWPYIEPLKDITARATSVATVQTSPRRSASEVGDEWDEITTETVEDNGQAIRKAKTEAAAINEEFKDEQPVHWRELLSTPLPKGLSINLDTAREGAADGKDAAN